MSFNLDDVNIGGQLKVGTGICPAIKEGNSKINGSALLEGPVVMGEPAAYTDTAATLMLAPLTNDDKDCVMPLTERGLSGTLPEVLQTKGNVYIDGDVYVTGSVDCESDGRLEARHSTADDLPKNFDMVHPTKGEGHRLRYACIEGPEVGVYFRGRLTNRDVIELPNYWKDLVHIDSISVQLQPIGSHQDIIIKRWDEEKVHLQSKAGMPIDCFYHVYAQRKDVNGIMVEYEGDTWEDYPDPKANKAEFNYIKNTVTR